MRWTWMGGLLGLVSCGRGMTAAGTGTCPAPVDPAVEATTSVPTGPGGDWCAVRAVFAESCTVCHQPRNRQGGLDLLTEPYTALVGAVSVGYGDVLVVPGDPEGSLLYRKITGTQEADEGAVMPIGGPLGRDLQGLFRRWIADGATDVCGTPTVPGGSAGAGAYHPAGWDDPLQHGLATNLQAETDCRSCHGSDLTGGTAGVACTSCHGAGWETTCTFCHGGVETPNGAPPEDIDNGTDPATMSFPPHTEHVAGARHLSYDCTLCHSKPTSALTPGHLFDDPTPGVAEIDFEGGFAAGGNKDGATCTVYCHGDGTGASGSVEIGQSGLGCGDCHATDGLGGRHELHLGEGFGCDECHPDAADGEITAPAQHVDGTLQVDLPAGIEFGQSCNGSCHGEDHDGREW